MDKSSLISRINRLFSEDVYDCRIALNLCKLLTNKEFLDVITCNFQKYKSYAIENSHGWCLRLKHSISKDDINNRYVEKIYDHYIEYEEESIFLDPKEYVMHRIRQESVEIHSIFLNEDLEKEFIKNNPDYEQYFKRKD